MDDLSSGEARRKAWAPKTLFIADPMESYNVKHDSTFLIAKTLAEQYPRAKLFFCKASDLMALGGVVFCKGRAFEFLGAPDPQPGSPLSMAAGCKPWFRYVEAKAEDFPTRPDPSARAESRLENGTVDVMALRDFDACAMRADPPFDMPYYFATHLLSLAESNGATVVNSGRALREYSEKLAILRRARFAPPTIVTGDKNEALAFWRLHGDVILKPLDGMGGRGIFRLAPQEHNAGSILETMLPDSSCRLMAQKRLAGIANGDKRVFVIGGKVMPKTVDRLAKKGETRANLAAGGSFEVRDITQEERGAAQAIAPDLLKDGVVFAGLDFIGGQLTEINVTSPTCLQEALAATGENYAEDFIEAMFAQAKRNAAPTPR